MPCSGGSGVEPGAAVRLQRLDERVALGAVGEPAAADVGGEVAALHERQHHGLGQRRRLAVEQHPRPQQRRRQRRGRDQVAQPQAREERLVERADVEHALPAIQALQGGERRAGVAELRGVVVLDDPGARATRPGQQFKPPRHRERDAERILVRGGDVDGARVRRPRHALSHDQSLRVDRNRLQRRAGRGERADGGRIGRVLDPDRRARSDQHPRGDVDGLLGARGDDHLRRRADHAARGAQVVGDGGAQIRVAGRLGVAEVLRPERAQRPPRGPAPGGERPRVHQRAAGVERRVARQRRRRRLLGDRGAVGQRRRGEVLRRGRSLGLLHAGQISRHEGARACPRLHISLGDQLLVGADHRGAGDAEPAGQVAARGQPRAGAERAFGDRAAHLAIDLAHYRPRPVRRAPRIDVRPAHRLSSQNWSAPMP